MEIKLGIKRILKEANGGEEGGTHISYRGTNIRMTADFLLEIMQIKKHLKAFVKKYL